VLGGKKFSRFVLQSLTLFLGLSFVLVAIGAYVVRSIKIDDNADQIYDTAQAGFSESLARHADYLFQRHEQFFSDDRMRKAIASDDRQLMSEMMSRAENLEDGDEPFLYIHRDNLFIPPLPERLKELKIFLEESAAVPELFRTFWKVGDRLISVAAMPLTDGEAPAVSGFIVYSISKDAYFWENIHNTRLTFCRVILHGGDGQFYDLETGAPVFIPDESISRLSGNVYGEPIRDILPDEVILPINGYSGMYYVANTTPWDEQKKSLAVILVYLCLFILAVTLLTAFFIARVVSRPLENMANDAFRIASNPSNVFLDEEKVGYTEFKKLSHAFNQVLGSLFASQEELRSKARKDLEKSEERYRLTVEAAPDMITLSKLGNGELLQVNELFLEKTGYAGGDVIGRTFAELSFFSDPESRGKIHSLLQKDDKINHLEIRLRLKSGALMDATLSARKIEYMGEPCIISIFVDCTEQKRAEEEKKQLETSLQRAQKMEAIGMLAGGVAHDLNNILAGLVGYPELLLLDLPLDSPLRKSILTIQKSGEKASAIVQDLLTLARRGVSATHVVNLNVVVEEYLKSPEHHKMMSYHPSVRLSTELAPDLMNIIGSDVHLSKTLMNLISNAVEAMSEGGDIVISTENAHVDAPIKRYDTFVKGDYAVLTVSDTGSGIMPEDQERIFEPFYTKKNMGRSGTGLGMAVVWGTVKDHNGYIDLQSVVKKGTTFKLYFPVTRKAFSAEDPAFLADQYRGNGETVLVVDDIPEQREIASDMLCRLGYSVSTLSSGEAAVEFMKHHSVDILVLDMVMDPGINGLETYKRIAQLHPGQKAVLASGYSETRHLREAQELGVGTYLKKPFLLKNIAAAIKAGLK
jgi:PAS domain S-box-containing protein